MTAKSRWLAVSALTIALGAGTMFLSAGRAKASTVFNLTGTFTDATTVSGTLTIDLTTGTVVAANLTYLGTTYATILLQESFTGHTAPGQTPVPVFYGVDVGSSTANFPLMDLGIPGTSALDSLVAYTGGALCSNTDSCGPDQKGVTWVSAFLTGGETFTNLLTGELTTAATPLPAALPLFATGLGALGLLGWRRKRKVAALAA